MVVRKTIFFSNIIFTTFCLIFVQNLQAQKLSDNILNHFHYREIGPTRQGGRVVAFAVSKQDPYLFFVGAGPGGLWKTVNNGLSFEAIFDHENSSTIGDVAVAPSDDEIVWVGTGEANLRNSTYHGDGVYKSTDGGQSWTNMGLKESHHIGRVLIHPTNPAIVYVAAQGHYYTENPERGVYKTANGGKTWTKSLEVIVDGRYVGATDLVMDPVNPDVLYATTYDRIRRPWGFTGAGTGSRIYKTTDGGKSWIKLENGLPGGFLGKIGLAIYPKNSDILYAIIEDANSPGVPDSVRQQELNNGKPAAKGTVGNIVYRTDDAGKEWRQVSEGTVGGRGNYYGQIVVDPNDAEHVYVMGTRVNESNDGGRTWKKAFRYGGDNHVLWIDPDDSRHMLLGYDYGMAITYDSGEHWYHPDELPMAQLYAIGVDMDYPYNVYGGMQDFGSWKGPSTKKGRFPIRFEDWEHMQGGDGFYNLVDPTNSRWLYSESQFGDLARIDQKTGVRKRIGIKDRRRFRFNWNTPILISPHNSNVIYQGANVVLRSPSRGEKWEVISPDLTKNDSTKFGGVEVRYYGTITTLDESPVKQGVIWVGTDDGNVQFSRNGGKTWTLLNARIPNNPEYWVSRVIASHHDSATAYLTFTGRHRTDFRPFVYKTTDYGQTWTSIASNLPNESVNVIREDRKNPNLLFVGTDRTVYVTVDGGKHWSELKNNLPTIPINDLVIHPRENDLVVGTFGRGFYITDISPLQEITPYVLAQEAYLFEIEPKVQWVMPSQPATSAQNFAGENEPHGVVVNYYLKQKVKGGIKIEVYDRTIKLNEIAAPAQAGINSVQWYMTKRRKRTPKEIVQLKEMLEGIKDEEDFYDFYDTVDYYLNPDDEVNALGQSLHTRVQNPGPFDREWLYQRVQPGEYTIKLISDTKVLVRKVQILQDYWYDKKY
ncbi:MAG: hypothetical protein ACE5IW_10140 [bacterium]